MRPLSQVIPHSQHAAGDAAAAWRRAPSPVLPPLPPSVLQELSQRPPSPATPESDVDLAPVCILSLDVTVNCGQEGDATFTIDGVTQAKATYDHLPQDNTEAAGSPVQALLGRGRENTEVEGCLTGSTSSVLFDEKYYEKDDFEPCREGGGEGCATPQAHDNHLVSFLSLQKQGGVTKLADTTEPVEDDFIEIDCDVQPMETLKRPLVYGYGCSPGGRLLRGSMQGEKRLSRASITSDYLEMDLVEAVLGLAGEGNDPHTGGSHLDLKETYWDHWTARQGETTGNMLYNGRSQDVKLPNCPSAKYCYDPEVLLAQVRCPKSLEDATFKQYSACIKSHIYDHFEAVQEGLREYGLAHEAPNFMWSQPDLPGLPGLPGLPREPGMWPLDYSSEPELGKPRPQAPRPPHVKNRDSSVDSGTWSYMQGSEDSTAVPSPRTCIPPVPFPRSSSSLSHVAVAAGAYDPWLHLLPDVTPPRTPRNSKWNPLRW